MNGCIKSFWMLHTFRDCSLLNMRSTVLGASSVIVFNSSFTNTLGQRSTIANPLSADLGLAKWQVY